MEKYNRNWEGGKKSEKYEIILKETGLYMRRQNIPSNGIVGLPAMIWKIPGDLGTERGVGRSWGGEGRDLGDWLTYLIMCPGLFGVTQAHPTKP